MASFETCWHNINSFCYICGKYVLRQYRVALSDKVEHIYNFYFGKVLVHRRWLPSICCKICYKALDAWSNGKRESMPFGVPMTWLSPGSTHIESNCYVCANDVHKMNQKMLNKHVYVGVDSAQLPKPHSAEIPIPKRPSPLILNTNNPDTIGPSTVGPSTVDPSLFVPDGEEEQERNPILMSQKHLHALARRLGLSKSKAEILASDLNRHNMLAPGANITSFRDRNSYMKQYFTEHQEKKFVFCHDINGLMTAMDNEYAAHDWRFFIDSSQSSLKGMLYIFIENVLSSDFFYL